MEFIDTDFNFFGVWNHHQRLFSLSMPKSDILSLSLLTKKQITKKLREMSFGSKIKFLITKETDYL